MDPLKLARLQAAAFAERNGIPVEHPFTAEELAPAHAQLDAAERDLYGERDDVPSSQQQRELRDAKLDDPRRGCVPPRFPR